MLLQASQAEGSVWLPVIKLRSCTGGQRCKTGLGPSTLLVRFWQGTCSTS